MTFAYIGMLISARDTADSYSAEPLHEGHMRLWRPMDWNWRRHIRQMRVDICCLSFSCEDRDVVRGEEEALLCIGVVRLLPGFLPGAERRGKPNRAARVIMAAIERPSNTEISCGDLFFSHRSRNTGSCSCQLCPMGIELDIDTSPSVGPDSLGGMLMSSSLTRILQKLKEKLILYRDTPPITHNLLIALLTIRSVYRA